MRTDGFWLIDKDKDWTSFDICAKLRKKINIKKCGHTGTLDPFATGLLLVATGKCTKLIPFLEKEQKTYIAKILIGKTSDTLDPESEIVNCKTSSPAPTKESIREVLQEKFQGKIKQTPPKFSAIKINGKKSCDLARKGIDVKMKERETEIIETEILNYDFPEIEIKLTVLAGFYVRSFANDLGFALGQGGGLCSELRRTQIGNLSVEDAENIEVTIEPIDPKFILKNMPYRELPTGRIQDFVAGRAFPMPGIDREKLLVFVGNHTVGVGEIIYGNLQPRIVL